MNVRASPRKSFVSTPSTTTRPSCFREASSGVPWIPTPEADRPIHRVPRGLPGPGGIGFAPRAQDVLGGYHQGFRHLTTIVHRPSGVGYCDWPVATPNT